MTKNAPPAVELLLCCVSPAGSVRRAERIRELSGQPLDWQYLLQMAAAHAVNPLLYWGLKANRPEAIPPSLARSFQENTRNSMQLTAGLLQLMELFARNGIHALPFKGPTLAMAAYGNLALRQFVDLDLLLSKEDALRARKALLENGYQASLQLNARREEAYMRAYDEFVLNRPDGHLMVELHWAVIPRYFSVSLDIGQFWERARPIQVARQKVPALCAEDLLLVLCLHGAKHCWSHLSMVADLAWLSTSSNVRWDEVLERGRELGSLRMVLLGAELGSRLLDMPLPETVVRGIAGDPEVGVLAEKIFARMFQPEGSSGIIWRAGSFHMRARERWQDRVRYCVRLTTTVGVEDWQIVDLPPSLAFLYSVLRFPRLLRKYWMRIP